MARKKPFPIGTLLFVLVFFLLTKLLPLYGDFLWFDSLAYKQIFTTILGTKVLLFVAGFVVTLGILLLQYALVKRTLENTVKKYRSSSIPMYIIVFFSFFVGTGLSAHWRTVLEYMRRVPFSLQDPIFGKDMSFYIFQLPFYEMIVKYLLLLGFISLALSFFMYMANYGLKKETRMNEETSSPIQVEAFSLQNGLRFVYKYALSHLSVIFACLFAFYGVSVYLSRYKILYAPHGAVFGAGYVDATITIPLLFVIAYLCGLGAIVALLNVKLHQHKVLVYIVVGIFGLLLLQGLITTLTQRFIVQPDEFNKEAPYLEHNIEFTRKAFNLHKISEEEFPVSDSLTLEQLRNNPETIQNMRLWDYRPLKTTYQQIQVFRSYYQFTDVDIDRYTIEDSTELVMLSAREIDPSSLPQQSRTWVNEHLVYTHGYGLTMSPVSQISKEGLPNLYVQDIPPKASIDLEIENPAIYFGENTYNYAIVGTTTQELDYPSGDENVYTTYGGDAGVVLDSALKRLTFAMMFGDINVFVSESIKDDSRLLLNRDLRTRVHKLAPFLHLDRDPYLVVAGGRLYWIFDTYTSSDRFPYSEKISFGGKSINYIRNSVKAVIDAYDGDVSFYVTDTEDPVIQVYERIFPGVFQPLAAMDAELREHIRYPEDFFTVQAAVYRDYHMQDPRVFYNKEDQWRFPKELLRGQRITMEPYYIIMKLPGEEKEEFMQVFPFIPVGRENMIAWIAARSDMPNYGQLKTFLFSKQSLVLGPMQVESKIDQDTDISEKITLWSQSGSNVIRGNLLAIPIEGTILYVEPLFLEATSGSSLPELRRVIVAFGDRVIMRPTFEEALDALFGDAVEDTGDVEEEKLLHSIQKQGRSSIEQAFDHYVTAKQKLSKGDLQGYADEMDAVGTILEQLQEE